MKLVRLQIEDCKFRAEMADMLCKCGFEVYCSSVSVPYSVCTLGKEHYLNVLVDETSIIDLEDTIIEVDKVEDENKKWYDLTPDDIKKLQHCAEEAKRIISRVENWGRNE